MVELPPGSRVARRPHYTSHGGRLRFLISRRDHAVMSAPEAGVFAGTERPVEIGALRERVGPGADAAVERLRGLEVVEVIEGDTAPGRRPVLVIEPHADDAALSLGGTMWARRGKDRYEVVTLASRSNFTSYFYMDREYFDDAVVSALRARESELFAAMVHGSHAGLGLDDAVLRYAGSGWSIDFFRRHRGSISALTAREARREDVERWTAAVAVLIRASAAREVWAPLGSPHADHRLTAAAVLGAAAADPALLEGRTLRLYQEVPYAARFPRYSPAALQRLRDAGYALREECWPIAGAMEAKLRLISVYASQFKLGAMSPDVLGCAGDPPVERTWVVEGFPAGVARPPAPSAEQRAAVAWVARHRAAPRIHVILVVAAGLWRHDQAMLRRAFPSARFEVTAFDAAAAEVESCGTAAVRVGSGRRAWARAGLRVLGMPATPTVVLTGPRRAGLLARAARVWTPADALVLSSLDPLSAACGGEP